MNDLIDTTEMYLRTIYDLEEEGVIPLRARIAERLEQSGPTVSQTVSRMERDGLLHVAGDRHLELTEKGRSLAIAVMRKHRLAERLLVDVIGLPWEEVHAVRGRPGSLETTDAWGAGNSTKGLVLLAHFRSTACFFTWFWTI